MTLMKKSKSKNWGALLLTLVFIFTTAFIPMVSALPETGIQTTYDPVAVQVNEFLAGSIVSIHSNAGIFAPGVYGILITLPDQVTPAGFAPGDLINTTVTVASDGSFPLTQILHIPIDWPTGTQPYKIILTPAPNTTEKLKSNTFSIKGVVNTSIAITKSVTPQCLPLSGALQLTPTP